MSPRESDSRSAAKPGFKAGYIALIGPTNVGKSTLLNRILDYPISIVAPKPQTTRHRILGILNGEGYQALFLDTPGMRKPSYKLQEMMSKEIKLALKDADVVLLMFDATRPDELESASGKRKTNHKGTKGIELFTGRDTLVAINKTDKVDKKLLLPLVERLAGQGFEKVYMISALKGDGVEELKKAVINALPQGEPFYPPDMISERPERFFVAEIVREAIFNRYGEEIPYSTTVNVEEFKEREGRKDFIRAVIYVERDSQKAIVIGKKGAALKEVGSIARGRIERFLGRPVFLELWVKKAEAWCKNERFIRENVYKRQG